MRTLYCLSIDNGGNLTRDGINVLLMAADWLLRNHQKQVAVEKKNEGFEVVISTEFAKRRIGVVEGFVFQARIAEDDKIVRTSFIVQPIHGPQPREFRLADWSIPALTHRFLNGSAALN